MMGRPIQRDKSKPVKRDAALVQRGIAEHLLDTAARLLARELECSRARARSLLIKSVKLLDE